MDIRTLQRDMKALGFYPGVVDGLWGPQSKRGYEALLSAARAGSTPGTGPGEQGTIAWGAKVSQTFKDRIVWTAEALRLPPRGADWLMACIAFESAETFRADIKNAAGSGATGLIQFMPATARALGTTTDALAAMTPEDQINYVYKYFRPYTGRLNNLGDVYMAILWPAGIGKPDDWVLWDKATRPTTYRQNAGLDVNKDGAITRGEAVRKVLEKADRGDRLFRG